MLSRSCPVHHQLARHHRRRHRARRLLMRRALEAMREGDVYRVDGDMRRYGYTIIRAECFATLTLATAL